MSQLLIQHYLNELQTLRRVSGTSRESVVREAFKTLLKDWGKSRDLIFIPEYEYITPSKDRRLIDGALLHALRVPLGYWEAKDEEDDLDEEIEKKFRKGYPQDNIVFDDSHTAVLIQNKNEVMRCGIEEVAQLEKLLNLFFGYERPEIADFRKAVEQFKTDLPEVLKALREMIEAAERDNDKFRKASLRFLKHAQDTINPNVTAADVREMLIQHILTEEIFSQVYDDSNFHRQNNVAKELYGLENTFFTGKVKHNTLAGLRPYYAAIKSAAALVTSHHEKQNFLKTIYENFYKVYDKKKADRLGVVYTPNEIVRFMIESADFLCQKHFGKSLIDRQVEILDPAAGTGTFITELIEHFRGQPAKLRYKYLEELHANEVAILPYYVANLNIEATYAAINGYEEFPNLCFVDTLDNTAGLRTHAITKGQHFGDLFGAVSEENVARIKRQNKKKISVVIGNPPYNVNQLNENENNKNREYPAIDARIRETYIAASAAQMTKLYDMYARFFRWASDRVDENGIVAFITNRSFIETRTFDGFRNMLAEEFNDIYVVDLGGDVRADPRLSGTKHNVFGIQTGVAISLMVKRAKAKGCRIYYARRPQMETSEEKLEFLGNTSLATLPMEEVQPNKQCDWINLIESDFESFVPLADRDTKSVQLKSNERAIFRLFTLGINSGRDDWMFDFSISNLKKKVRFLLDFYHEELRRLPPDIKTVDIDSFVRPEIKWTIELKTALRKRQKISVSDGDFVSAVYRPFVKMEYCFNRKLTKRVFRIPDCQPTGVERNRYILFPAHGATKRVPFCVFATDHMPDLNFFTPDPAHAVVRYRYEDKSKPIDNITDWGREQFREHYEDRKNPKRPISNDSIFHYIYGVLHDPIYREKYVQDLKREFPRIPFYSDFWRWAEWGEKLMALHIGYETVEPWPLERIDAPDQKSRKAGLAPKAMLKADKDTGNIQLDGETQLTGVPPKAWAYKLGNRSALEWILDQYKEKTPKDPTIREKFNTYRFADHKEKVIDLLKRVTRVSVETMKIVAAMKAEKR
jgi:predicted helicase